MSHTTETKSHTKPRSPWVRRGLIALAAGFALLLVLWASLPFVVRSASFRHFVEKSVLRASGYPLTIQTIDWSWGAPFVITHGGIEAPEKGLTMQLDSLRIGVRAVSLLQRGIDLDVAVSGLHVTANPELLKGTSVKPVAAEPEDAVRALRAGVQSLASLLSSLDSEYSLPLLVQGRVDVTDTSLRIVGEEAGWHAQNITLRIDGQNPLSAPVMVSFSTDVSSSGVAAERALPVTLNGRFTNPGTEHITPNRVNMRLTCSAPGVEILAQGAVATGLSLGVKAHLNTFVPFIAPLVRPFVDQDLPVLSGLFRGDVSLSGSESLVQFETLAVLQDFSAHGGGLAGPVGPLTLRNTQQGTVDVRAGVMEVESGLLQVDTLARLDWAGTVHGLYDDTPALKVTAGPFSADVAKALDWARPFLASLPQFTCADAKLAIDNALFKLSLADGHGQLDVTGAALHAGKIVMARGAEPLQIQGCSLRLAELAVPLVAMAPTRATMRAGASCKGVQLGPSQSFSIADFPTIDLQAEDTGTGLGSGRVRLALHGSLQGVHTPQLPVAVKEVTLKTNVQDFSLATLMGNSISLDTAINGYNLAAAKIETVDLKARAIKANATLSVAPALLESLKILPPRMLQGSPVLLMAEYDGALPDETALQKSNKAESLRERLQTLLAGVRSARTELRLEKQDVRYGELFIRGLSLSKPVVLTIKPQGSDIALSGAIAIGDVGIDGLEKQNPWSASARMKARIKDLALFQGEYTASVPIFGLVQSLEATSPDVCVAADALSRDGVAGLLHGADARLRSQLKAHPQNSVTSPQGIRLEGELDTTAEMELEAGRLLRIQYSGQAKHLRGAFGPALSIDDLDGQYKLAREFHIGRSVAADSPAGVGLSRSVLSASRKKKEAPRDALFSRRVVRDLRGQEKGGRTITCSAIRWDGPPVPVALQGLEMQVGENAGIPSLEFFQIELMGGTVQGGVFIAPHSQHQAYSVQVRSAFTGLDANTLLPASVSKSAEDDTELSGQLALDVPLADDPAHVLEHMQLRLDLTHVGVRTLERLLRSLDPHEENQTIVNQRKLLRMGTPRNIRLRVANGNLSLSGEVVALGVNLDLPRLTRFNLAGLPIRDALRKQVALFGPVVKVLHFLSANRLATTPKGQIHFDRVDHAEK